jgi:CRP-like cAMP-binding protein
MLIINTEQGEKVRQETVGVTSYSKDDNQLHLFNIQKESIKRIISENIAELQQRVCTITDQFLHHAVNIEDNKPSPNYNCINFEEPFTSQFLSLNEQLILKQLFSHPPLNSESISIMDKILFKISFFQNQPISARKNIIRHGSFRIYEPNQVIYNIDDEGDSLYIILMGSVYVYILDSRYSSQPILNRLLIDGDCFGEAAKSNTNNKYKRTSKIVASETTHIIELERRYLSVDSSFRKSQSQRDLLKNTDGGNFFTSVLLFFDSPLDALASLLSAVTMKTYKYGEVILKKGDVPEGLYVIYEGECIVVNDCQVAKQSKYVVSTRQGFSDYAQLMGVNPEKALGEIDNKNINNPINIPESKRVYSL